MRGLTHIKKERPVLVRRQVIVMASGVDEIDLALKGGSVGLV